MSGNSEQPGTPGNPPAKPVKVVRPAPETAAPPAKKAAAPAASPAKKAAAPAAAKKAPAPAPKAAPAAPAARPAAAAPAKKAAAPAAAKKAPAPAKKAPAPSTARQTTPAQPAPAPAAPAAEETAVRSGFGARLKGGLAKAATFTDVADADGAETSTSYAAVSGSEPSSGAAGRSPRRARLRLSRIDPWSVAKVSFLLSVALGIVTFVAVLITWSVLGAAGVWDSINSVVASVASTSDGSSAFDVEDYVGTGRILGLTLIVSVINVVLLTAMATLAAYLYNMAAALLGGVEVTLSEGND